MIIAAKTNIAEDKVRKQQEKMRKKQKKMLQKQKQQEQKLRKKEERQRLKQKRKDPHWQLEQKEKKAKEKLANIQKKQQQKAKNAIKKEKDKAKRAKAKQKKAEQRAQEKARRLNPEYQAQERQKKQQLKLKKEQQKQKKAEARAKAKVAKAQAALKKREQAQIDKAKRKDPQFRAAEKLRKEEAKMQAKAKKEQQKQRAQQKKRKDQEKRAQQKAAKKAARLEQHPPMEPRKKMVLSFLALWLLGSLGGAGYFFWEHPQPAGAAERYLAAFGQNDVEAMARYGAVDIDFVSDHIVNDALYQPLEPVVSAKVYDIDYTLGETVVDGEQAVVDAEFLVYDLGDAMREALVSYRKENLVKYVSGKYDQAELDQAMIALLDQHLSAVQKDHPLHIQIKLHNIDGKWRVDDLAATNTQLAHALTGCLYGEETPEMTVQTAQASNH